MIYKSSPIIGLTISRNTHQGDPQMQVSEKYIQALVNAGACPVLIPLGIPDKAYSKIVDRIDAILFTGGGDIHPSQYSSQEHPLVSDIDIDRDRVELQLFNQALKKEKPFLGICRGLQLINVALGGSLYEDINDQRLDSLEHRYSPDYPRNYLAHPVELQSNTLISKILDSKQLLVNSLHHQGIKEPAPNLISSAHAPDGLIEAVELRDYNFGLAVQWHPECLLPDIKMAKLFQAFVEVAASH